MGHHRFLVAGAALAILLLAPLRVIPGPKKRVDPLRLWPSPPERARIQFVEAFSSPADLHLKRTSFFKGLLKKALGLETRTPSMLMPYGVVTDSRGRILAVDNKLRAVHIFDRQQKMYYLVTPQKHERLVSPVGLAVDAADNFYVSDSYQGKIFVFDRSGKMRNVIGRPEGKYKRSTGIAIDKDNRVLYVVDTLKHMVEADDLDGKELFRFGHRGDGPGEFNYPTQICIRGERVYVTDTLNARIQIFDLKGKYLSSFGRLGTGAGDLDKAKGVALDSEGHVYVVEGLHDVVQIYDADGRFLLAFGSTGSARGEFYLPTAIHIDNEDRIYVADSYNRRIEVFQYLRDGTTVASGE